MGRSTNIASSSRKSHSQTDERLSSEEWTDMCDGKGYDWSSGLLISQFMIESHAKKISH